MRHVGVGLIIGVVVGAGVVELSLRHFEHRYRKLFGFRK